MILYFTVFYLHKIIIYFFVTWFLRQAMRLSSVISAIGWLIIYFAKVFLCANFFLIFLSIISKFNDSISLFFKNCSIFRGTYLWILEDFSRVMVAVPYPLWYDIFHIVIIKTMFFDGNIEKSTFGFV